MKRIKNLNGKTVFFIGIGGVSMSGLAMMVESLGGRAIGSDSGDSDVISTLRAKGIEVFSSHSAKNITKNIDIVVYSLAISRDNPEFVMAKLLDLEMYERGEFLGILSQNYDNVIAVSGTHGKTTTTSLIAEIFTNAGLCPTIHIGGESVNLGSNTIVGHNEFLIVEACEYRESFRFIRSNTCVITNIECDHMDYYKDYAEIFRAFKKFYKKSKWGVLSDNVEIFSPYDERVSTILDSSAPADLECDWVVRDIRKLKGGYSYKVYYNQKLFGKFDIHTMGKHNILDSVYAIAVANHYGIGVDVIRRAISHFKGVKRRFQTIGRICNCPVIIDYAHHPTEIKASIDGIREFYNNPLIVFQPHTYSRTYKLFDDFVNVLQSIDNLILYPTYPARENEIIGGRAEDLAFTLKNAQLVTSLDECVETIGRLVDLAEHDVVLVLGAGDLATKLERIIMKN